MKRERVQSLYAEPQLAPSRPSLPSDHLLSRHPGDSPPRCLYLRLRAKSPYRAFLNFLLRARPVSCDILCFSQPQRLPRQSRIATRRGCKAPLRISRALLLFEARRGVHRYPRLLELDLLLLFPILHKALGRWVARRLRSCRRHKHRGVLSDPASRIQGRLRPSSCL